ncbi:SDR family oxidoreductase [Paenibacillus aceris]|uniref:NAD(P)-dependent dehydrogenase (Short-subunit alcohol dehydrogenase family) n=1 Tax=Paenibacillus aceris TaxID=869555 RepID=A0ABS4HSI5_9BACL|nr:SDR family oxidoreductase [Paenibacillus aceris]MBP1961588.1 NAD(P)-dependent dehydrogenase (short-subunit alcohol dehydrogenase family) [Paenibacillus aceris]NHW37639.1 SDR family oxidoreductase [Paenibacillus aceris]
MSTVRGVALVTGASSGFGLLTSIALAGRGYRVIATMRDLSRSESLLLQAERAGLRSAIDTMVLDVTIQTSIETAVSDIMKKYGRIDVLVNNAGFAVGGYVEDVPMEAWRSQLETNVFGVIATTKAVLPYMRASQSGCIVNVSSVSGLSAFPGYAPYSTSKFAIEGFSESLRLEMMPFGVRVVLVEPGAYRTEIWRKGFEAIHTTEASPYWQRLGSVLAYSRKVSMTAPDPQDVADTIARLVDKRGPKLRYPLGRGVKMGLWARSLLPWKWYEGLLNRLLK